MRVKTFVLGLLIFLGLSLLTCLLGLSFSHGKEPSCPSGYTCLPPDVAARVKKDLMVLQCLHDDLDQQLLQVIDEPVTIITTEDGQVFIPDQMVSRLTWCDFELELKRKTSVRVLAKKQSYDGFNLRLRLALQGGYLPDENFIDWWSPAIQAQFFGWNIAHLSVTGSLKGAGLVVGMDITRNLDLGAGLTRSYGGAWVPIVSLSLALN